MTVLTVMGVSPSLSVSDFERLIPRGEHIEAWRSPGDVLYVIPARNRNTLEPQALYYLVFSNKAMARAYKEHLEHLHAIAQEFTPTSLLSKDLPQSGTYVRGENIGQIIHDYTLCPPSQELKIAMHVVPEDNVTMKHLLDGKGYRVFMNTTKAPKSGRSAVVWIDGPQDVTVPEMIRRDGFARGQMWGALGKAGDIVPLDVPGTGERSHREWLAGLQKKAKAETETKTETKPETRVEPPSQSPPELDSAPESPSPASPASAPSPPDAPPESSSSSPLFEDEDAEFPSPPARKPSDRRPQRWLVTFGDESEARRFVRRWHRRHLPGLSQGSGGARGDVEMRPSARGEVRAEFAW
jgi:hypothetical protein